MKKKFINVFLREAGGVRLISPILIGFIVFFLVDLFGMLIVSIFWGTFLAYIIFSFFFCVFKKDSIIFEEINIIIGLIFITLGIFFTFKGTISEIRALCYSAVVAGVILAFCASCVIAVKRKDDNPGQDDYDDNDYCSHELD